MNVLLVSLGLEARQPHQEDVPSSTRKTYGYLLRDLTVDSSSRWAGAITKSTHDQWALARRCLAAHIQNLARVSNDHGFPVSDGGGRDAISLTTHRLWCLTEPLQGRMT
jgi:hypothetical protein